MRILAHIHTFNDADIIARTIEAVRRQTRPVAAILVVDNGSTDGTLDQPAVKHTEVIRHKVNVGTSGAVATGMQFALRHDYDWIWIFDADSTPAPDALERLLDLYAEFPQDLRNDTALLACLPHNQADGRPLDGTILTRRGRIVVRPTPPQRYYSIHVTIWSGALYRLAAVREFGTPNLDYVLDMGEYEYGYRMAKAGYRAFMLQDAGLQHNIRGARSLSLVTRKLGPLRLTFCEDPPIRCYYLCRNMLYFTLYECIDGRLGLLERVAWPFRGVLWRVRFASGNSALKPGVVWQVLLFACNFLLRPHNHRREIAACFRGIWHGITGNISARY
jgi:GT2 family glycosyltransferase